MCMFRHRRFQNIVNASNGRPAIVRPVEHDGAMLNARITKKEAIVMIEKLKEYVAKYDAKKNELANTPIDVEEKVQAYREACIKEAEAARTAEISKLENIIAGLNEIIKQEEAVDVAVEEITAAATA